MVIVTLDGSILRSLGGNAIGVIATPPDGGAIDMVAAAINVPRGKVILLDEQGGKVSDESSHEAERKLVELPA